MQMNGGGQISKSDLITHFTSRACSKLVAYMESWPGYPSNQIKH